MACVHLLDTKRKAHMIGAPAFYGNSVRADRMAPGAR